MPFKLLKKVVNTLNSLESTMDSSRIVPWQAGYYPDITNATADQQRSFNFVVNKIRSCEYIDVGDNIAYLFAFQYETNKKICFEGKSACFEALHDYRNYIKLYGKDYPKVVLYALPWILFANITCEAHVKEIETDFNTCAKILVENDMFGYVDVITALFLKALNISSSSHVSEEYLKLFVGNNLSQYITEFGKEDVAKIIEKAISIIDTDFKENNVNYLYRMYDFEEGVVSAQGEYNLTYEKKSDCIDSIFKFPQIELLIPKKNSKKNKYIKAVMREAENNYRHELGVNAVGEGWISETLLFKQIETAFDDTTVLQHASPSFLGRQHYDVYLPEYKIALEYQGEQHFSPVEVFGGEDGFAKGQERDKRKRNLSRKNGVYLIEVMPKYDISNVIQEILERINGKSDENAYELEATLQKLNEVDSIEINIDYEVDEE